jgi:DNA-binding winged helix-turn-helix (wHTH) protein
MFHVLPSQDALTSSQWLVQPGKSFAASERSLNNCEKRAMSPSQRYAFGDFVLERSQQQVRRRDGSDLNLSPRLFSALLLFVENAGALLDKDALMQALWPGLVVEDNSLSQIISSLRRALADDTHDSRYIQTVPRRGFRFIATVTELPDPSLPPDRRRPMPAGGSCRTSDACCAWHWRLALPRVWQAWGGGYRAVRRKQAPRRRYRPWLSCPSSRWCPRLATSCSKWAWPTA